MWSITEIKVLAPTPQLSTFSDTNLLSSSSDLSELATQIEDVLNNPTTTQFFLSFDLTYNFSRSYPTTAT